MTREPEGVYNYINIASPVRIKHLDAPPKEPANMISRHWTRRGGREIQGAFITGVAIVYFVLYSHG